MIKFEYKISEEIEAVKGRLRYVAGKRSEDKNFYFRHTACEADHPLLIDICREALAAISLGLGVYCEGMSVDADSLSITLKGEETEENAGRRQQIGIALIEIIRNEILQRWLTVTGYYSQKENQSELNDSLATLRSKLLGLTPLRSRRIPPL